MCVTQFPKRSGNTVLYSRCARTYNTHTHIYIYIYTHITKFVLWYREGRSCERNEDESQRSQHRFRTSRLERNLGVARSVETRRGGEKIGSKYTHVGNSRNPAEYRAAAIPGWEGVNFSRDVPRNLEILSNWIISLRGERVRIAISQAGVALITIIPEIAASFRANACLRVSAIQRPRRWIPKFRVSLGERAALQFDCA